MGVKGIAKIKKGILMRTIWSLAKGCNVWSKKVILSLNEEKREVEKLLHRAYPQN